MPTAPNICVAHNCREPALLHSNYCMKHKPIAQNKDDIVYGRLWVWEIVLLVVAASILTLLANFLLQRSSTVTIKKANCAVVNTCGALAAVADMPPTESKDYPIVLPNIAISERLSYLQVTLSQLEAEQLITRLVRPDGEVYEAKLNVALHYTRADGDIRPIRELIINSQ